MLINKYLMTLNTNMANFISEMRNVNSAPIREINQEIEKAPKNIGETEQSFLNLAEKLKATEIQLRTFGNTTQANKLKEMLKMINAETTDIKGSMNELRQYIEKTFGTDALKQFDKELKNIDNSTKNVSKKSNFGKSLKTALGIGTVALGIRKAYHFLQEANTEAVDYAETVNLFNVAMGKKTDQYGNLDREASKYYTKAIAFQEKLSDKLHINIEESMNYQALFNAMSKSMGIAEDKAYLLSENFTKLGYDLSSLYNIDPENAMQKLRAGLSGQTKPLRDLGLDITQQSLEPLLDRLGIERSVKQLSQAEKMVARYIVVLEQAKIAHGDFANTMDSPANQLRIFNAQLTAFKRNMGSLWQGLLGNILPYVNAIMMVINELLKMVAKLFGFEVWEQDVSISTDIGADDLVDDLGTASQKAKEFKKQLMGFDEINNITLPDKVSGGAGSGASVGGIDERLLNAMQEYDNLMDKVSNKATEIKDKILEWLGVTDGTYTNLNRILDVVKEVGLGLLGWSISKGVLDFMQKLGMLQNVNAFQMAFGIGLTITGITAQMNGTQKVLDGDIDLFSLLETLGGTAVGTFGIFNILRSIANGKGDKVFSTGQSLKIGFGAMLAVQGVQVVADGISKDDIFKQIGGILETGTGAFIAGSGFKDLKFGLQAGLIVTLATAEVTAVADMGNWIDQYFDKWKQKIYPYKEELNIWEGIVTGWTSIGEGFQNSIADITSKYTEMTGVTKISREELKNLRQEANNASDAYKNFSKSIEEKINNSNKEIDVYQEISKELINLVDSNGKVKSGYENRVDFILNELNSSFNMELKRDGEIITKNGEVIDSNKQLQESIDKVIKQRKKELELEVHQETYKERLKQKIELQERLNKAIQKQKEAQEELDKIVERMGKGELGLDAPIAYLTAVTNLETAKNAVSDLNKSYTQCEKDIAKTDERIANLMVSTTGTVSGELINQGQIFDETLIEMSKENKEQWNKNFNQLNEESKIAMLTMSTTAKENSPIVIKEWENLSKGSFEEFKKYMNKTNEEALETVLQVLTTTQGLTPNIIQAWSYLSNLSAKEFNNGLKDLPEDTRAKILANVIAVNGMNEANKQAFLSLSEEGRKAFDRELANMSPNAQQEIQNMINAIDAKSGSIYNTGFSIGNILLASSRAGQSINGGSKKLGSDFGDGYIKGIKEAEKQLITTSFNLGLAGLKSLQKAQNSHSPSKETLKLGNYFTEGYIMGLKEKMSELRKTVGNLVDVALKGIEQVNTEEITINPNDFKIDTNQFIDYGQISGAIATQSNVNVSSDIEGRIENAIYRGLSNATIPVEIEATTDEGVIFKKIQVKAKEFTMQTGEPAFEF